MLKQQYPNVTMRLRSWGPICRANSMSHCICTIGSATTSPCPNSRKIARRKKKIFTLYHISPLAIQCMMQQGIKINPAVPIHRSGSLFLFLSFSHNFVSRPSRSLPLHQPSRATNPNRATLNKENLAHSRIKVYSCACARAS